MGQPLRPLPEDFGGAERVRQLLLNRTPKYGNRYDDVGSVMVDVVEAYFEAVDG